MKKILLAVLLVTLGWTSWQSWNRIRAQKLNTQICSFVVEESFEKATELGVSHLEDLAPEGVECLALSLVEVDRTDEAMVILAGFFRRTQLKPLLSSETTSVFLSRYRAQVDAQDFLPLAQRAMEAFPQDRTLLTEGLRFRNQFEEEVDLLRQLSAEDPPLLLRQVIGKHYLSRREYQLASEVLGDDSTLSPESWYPLKAKAFAGQGRVEDVDRLFDRWHQEGGHDPVILAHYALLVSLYGLQDRSGIPPTVLLERAVHGLSELNDEILAAKILQRYISHLIVLGRTEDALQRLEEFEERWGPGAMSRQDILRSSIQARMNRGESFEVGSIVFKGVSAMTDGALWVSDDGESIDRPFIPLSIDPGVDPALTRPLERHPLRWVLKDWSNRVCASGSTWPVPGSSIEVAVEVQECIEQPKGVGHENGRGDGRRRVFLVVLDCADWRIMRYLQARSELPFIDWVLSRGVTAVLSSNPPFTAAAIRKLAYPIRRANTFLGTVFQIGSEIEALNFVEASPFRALDWFLPSSSNIFEVMGSGDHEVVNLLHNHGVVKAGVESTIIGPYSKRRKVTQDVVSRTLTDQEQEAFPLLKPNKGLIKEIAGEFDIYEDFARVGEVDLLIGRVAALDILTHGNYAQVANDGQDDGQRVLYEVYRYIDHRLDILYGQLDSDDILVIMSDHGIRTAMEHDERAFFTAVGAGVQPQEVAGEPELQGIGQMVAVLLGESVDWPATGIETWAAELRVGESPGNPPAR